MYIIHCMRQSLNQKGFTLIELLVVISVIGFLAAASLVVFNNARINARNVKRLADIRQVIKALELYYDANSRYPDGDGDGCGGWDTGNQDYPLLTNGGVSKLGQFMPKPPRDATATGNCSGYRYYRYSAGSSGCDVSKGAFYIIMVSMEGGTDNIYPGSPGFSCPSRNWQTEASYDWVTGGFEN